MKLSKYLMNDFSAIMNIKKLGRDIIAINFKFSFDANNFVER